MAGGWCAVYCVLLVWLIHQYRENRSSGRKLRWGYLFASSILLLCAIFLCYQVKTGSRQLMGFIVIILLMAGLYNYRSRWTAAIAFALLWLFVIKSDNGFDYSVPNESGWYTVEIEKGREQLEGVLRIDENALSPWDNTVIWDLGNYATYWENLYAFPPGIGINCCMDTYILEYFEELQSKYLLTNIGSDVDLYCESAGKSVLADYGHVHVYQLH